MSFVLSAWEGEKRKMAGEDKRSLEAPDHQHPAQVLWLLRDYFIY